MNEAVRWDRCDYASPYKFRIHRLRKNCLNSAQHGGPPAPPPSLRSRVGFGGSGSGLGLGLLPCRVGSLGGGRSAVAAGCGRGGVSCRLRAMQDNQWPVGAGRRCGQRVATPAAGARG
jgi:hypothetical protein